MTAASFAAATSGEGPRLEPGQYVLTVTSIEPAEGGNQAFGPSVKWTFAVADVATPDDLKADDNGGDYEFWAFTSIKMSPQARARQWTEALVGRQLADGEKIDPSSLIGKRMQALVIHEEGDNGMVRAKVSREMPPKPFGAVPAAPAPKAAPAAANGTADTPTLLERWKKGITKAELLEIDGLGAFRAIDPTLLSDVELKGQLLKLGDAITAA